MARANTFDDKSVKRIADNVLWGEGVRSSQHNIKQIAYQPQGETIYVQLTVKDEDDYGYWKGEEVSFKEGVWTIVDGGRKWDGDEHSFIRHINWEDAQLNSIVHAFQITDTLSEDKPYIWVFDKEVTNPQAFIFYADGTGNTGQSTGADTWTMTKGGTVYTNSGKMEIPDGFQMAAGKAAFAKLEFIYITSEWILANAEMVIDEDPEYWEEDGYGTLTVHVKIASTEIKKDVCRLTQHHAGDIRFELHKDVTVTSGSPWISVTNFASNYSVAHILPPDKHQDEFLTFTGNCDDIPTGSFEDFIYWFTNNLVHIRYDQLGHIYERENCYGDVEDYTDDEEDDDGNELKLAGSLTATLNGSEVEPYALQSGGDITTTYKVLNGVKNYTDYIGANNVMLIVKNSLGNLIPIATAGAGPYSPNILDLAANVAGTSGRTYPIIEFNRWNFRYNDTITVSSGMAGLGLGASKVLGTATATTTITAPTEVRDYEDPNATNYTIQVSNSHAGDMSEDDEGGYSYVINFLYGDGTPVSVRYGGQANQFSNGETAFALDANNDTEFIGVSFDLKDGVSHGDNIKMTARLQYSDFGGLGQMDANSSSSQFIYVAIESDCLSDENGEHLEDATDDCLTDDVQNVTIQADSATGTAVTLQAGTYRLSHVSGAFDFLTNNWKTITKITGVASGLFPTTPPDGYATEAEAEASLTGVVEDVVIPSDGSYNFVCDDTFYGDNSGAMTLKITRL